MCEEAEFKILQNMLLFSASTAVTDILNFTCLSCLESGDGLRELVKESLSLYDYMGL